MIEEFRTCKVTLPAVSTLERLCWEKRRRAQQQVLAKEEAADPYQALEAVLPWDTFVTTVQEASTLARPADFDYLGFHCQATTGVA